MFLTGKLDTHTGGDNGQGLYGIRFYIRGKPWVITTDDKLLYDNGNGQLMYTQPADNGAMWAPILEKAWAKAKGTYAQTNGGFVVNGLRAVTAAPVFTYSLASAGLTADETFALLDAANDVDYPMGAGTSGTSDSTFNDCGIANAHAYSIIGTYTMDSYDMVLLRNPWGLSYYSGTWSKDDGAWTDALVAQVPYGIDPRTSDSDGIFTMEISDFIDTSIDCINDY